EVVLRTIDAAPRSPQVGHSPAEHDAFQFEPLGELASLLVEPAADPGATHLGVDAHLVTVEEIAGRVVPAPVTVAGDLVPRVRLERLVAGEAHARAIAAQPLVEHGDEAAGGQVVQLAADLAERIGLVRSDDPPGVRADPAGVVLPGLPNLALRFRLALGHQGVKPRSPSPPPGPARSPRRIARSSPTAGRGRSAARGP